MMNRHQELAALTQNLLNNAKIEITGRQLPVVVDIHNWLEQIASGQLCVTEATDESDAPTTKVEPIPEAEPLFEHDVAENPEDIPTPRS